MPPPPVEMAPTHAPTRGRASLGGILPAAAAVHSGSVRLLLACVELHRDGAILPLVVQSDVPGLLRWDPREGLDVHDDAGTAYTATPVTGHSGLGAMLCTVWISPAPPPGARSLTLVAHDIARVSVPRGGTGVLRALRGGPWEVVVPLMPARTVASPPAEPSVGLPAATVAGAPVRSLAAYTSTIPIGQARVGRDAAVCVWGVEGYGDRAVITLCVLHNGPAGAWDGELEMWDDLGATYMCAPMQEVTRDGWTEVGLEVRPGVDPAARRLGLRVTGAAPPHTDLAGPLVFGVDVPA